MKIELAIIGQGAVTPAGIGAEALARGETKPEMVAPLAESAQSWPVLRVDQKNSALIKWQKEPRFRRASPISYYLVEAAAQALTNVAPADRAQTGLIVAFSAGCLAYSRRFFEAIITQGPKSASPALFPETVFNSPISHVAAVLGLNGAAYALVSDETGWIAGLKTASVWLRQERLAQVLVLGAEEFDPVVLNAYRRARWLRRQNDSNGFIASEGAAGTLVRLARWDDALIITDAYDGFVYRTKKEAAMAAHHLTSEIDPSLPVYQSAQKNWLASCEAKVIATRSAVRADPYLGEAFAASAAWNTLRAVRALGSRTPRICLPLWGLNHQLGALLLEKRF